MSHEALSSEQFDPGRTGPTEARHRYTTKLGLGQPSMPPAEIRRQKVEGHQTQLFPVEGHDFTLEPHQQTREQFANDPRTWFHGRHSELLPKTGGAVNAGIHFGTLASAHQRKQKLGPSHRRLGSGEMQPYRFFPVRLTGSTVNTPETAGPDEGAKWKSRPGTYFYKNEVEDRGHISAKVPDRSGVMTHGDFIKAAGKKVHPAITWENKQLGRRQYAPHIQTGEEIRMEHEAKRQAGPHVLQPTLFTPEYRGTTEAMERRRDLLKGAGMMQHNPMTGKEHPTTDDASRFLRFGYLQ